MFILCLNQPMPNPNRQNKSLFAHLMSIIFDCLVQKQVSAAILVPSYETAVVILAPDIKSG